LCALRGWVCGEHTQSGGAQGAARFTPLQGWQGRLKIQAMRLSDARFLLAWLLPGFTLLGLVLQPAQAAFWTLAIWWGIALVDLCVPGAQRSPAALPASANLAYFSWVLRGYALLQLVLIGVGAWAAAQQNCAVVLGLAFAVGFVTGSQGITFAHELGHSKSKIDRLFAWVLMSTVCYGHFMVEHYRGHHPRAATFEDPASARRGESLYGFLPRTLWGSLRSGWRLEGERLRQMNKPWAKSPLLWSALASLGMLLIGFLMPFWLNAGANWTQDATKIVAFLVLQSLVAVLLLEMVNYIEHYGLRRDTQAGKREPFGMMHAWNADHVATNSLLANLQRHSDHHMHAYKPYPTLEPLPGPQLPTGYAGCLLLAMLPPLWFGLMHKRLAALAA
jgi:alkane 1-monooxygenase